LSAHVLKRPIRSRSRGTNAECPLVRIIRYNNELYLLGNHRAVFEFLLIKLEWKINSLSTKSTPRK